MESVKCTQCGSSNPLEYSYCTKCGYPLPAMSDTAISVKAEIQRLRGMLNHINNRLDALEGKQALSQTQAEPEKIILPDGPMAEITPELPPVKEPLPAEAQRIEEFFRKPATERKTAAVEKKSRKEGEWEQILGGNWLARIGILALIIGIGFFLKYAFDNNWLGPQARVILGCIAGLVMLGLGFFWRKRYPVLTQVLSGGGIAVFYLSIFAASATYNLINIYAATGLLLAASILATLLALRYNSIALSIIGIFGAYFAPFALGGFSQGRGTGTNSQANFLLIYIVIIGLGVSALSAFRNWRWFTLLGLSCSLITYGFWYGEFHRSVTISTAEIGITAIFLIFTGATTLFHIISRKVPAASDYFLMLGNAAAYAIISLSIMWDQYRVWMGGFTLLLAIFYGLFAYVLYKRNTENRRLSRFTAAIALGFITITIPVQFGDHAVTTIGWGAEGLILMWLAFREKLPIFRRISYFLFMAMAVRLIAFDTWPLNNPVQPVFNERFLAFIFSIAFTWAGAYLLRKNREVVEGIHYEAFVFAADFLAIWVTGIEVFVYSHPAIRQPAALNLLVPLALTAGTILNLFIWRRKPISLDSSLAIFNAGVVVIISTFLWYDLRVWMGTGYLLFAIIYGILAYHALKKTDDRMFGNITLVIAMIFLAGAVPVGFTAKVLTPILWAIEISAFIWLSFKLKLPVMRYFTYILFTVMAGDLLIVKTVNTADFTPVINQRFLAYIIGIAAAYFSFTIIRKQRQDLPEWSFAGPYLLIAANFLTLWLISFEVWDAFGGAITSSSGAARDSLTDARNLALTGAWAICAVAGLVTGIMKHWRFVRIGSLVLLAITILKVFTFDVFQLETNYRIIAFVGLGVLLLISAYFYQRYRGIIKEVLTK